MPRRTTLLHAIPSRTDSRNTRPHIRDASRTSTGCYTRGRTRTRYSRCALIWLATLIKHRSIIREPYQANASYKAARIGSSYAQGCVSVFVLVRRFGEDSTDRYVSALFVFFSENSVVWVKCSSCIHTLWCLWCRLAMPRLMPTVSRMGLCCSLFLVPHSLCQLVSFFSTRSCFFFGPCHVSSNRLVTNFSFEPSFLEGFNLKPRGFRTGFWVSGCAGVWVLVTGTRLYVRRAASMLPVFRRLNSAAGRQTPRIH